MKKIAFLLALSLAIFAFAACGKVEVVNGGNGDAKESGETEEFAAPEKVDIYEIEDILGCWYGANNGGEKYLMRVFASETAAGTYHRFTLNSYGGGEAESLFGDVYLYTDEWEEGVTSTSCTLAANVVGGNFTEEAKVGFGTFYEDGSFAYTPLYMTEPDENGAVLTDIERMEADKLTFTREFDAPVLKVDREGADNKIIFTK